MPKQGDFKIWWIPQVPMKAFEVLVPDGPDPIKAAAWLLYALAKYDMFQYENNVKPDYSNAGGLMIYDEVDGWTDWYDDNGDDIDVLFYGGNEE